MKKNIRLFDTVRGIYREKDNSYEGIVSKIIHMKNGMARITMKLESPVYIDNVKTSKLCFYVKPDGSKMYDSSTQFLVITGTIPNATKVQQ